MIRWCSALLFLIWPLRASAIAPEDFVSGIELHSEPGKPLQEMLLPNALYAGVRRADLSDLRVFNAEGVAVPHALCAAAPGPDAAPQLRTLRVFPLQAAAQSNPTPGTHVELKTDDEVDLRVRPRKKTPPAATAVAAYVIDTRDLQQPIQALHLDWRSPDGASTVEVRVEGSEDLDRWTLLVAGATLLHADANGQRLERARITLPWARYVYLRLQRIDQGPQPELRGVSAEIASTAAMPNVEWFEAAALSADAEPIDPPSFVFDAWHLAPLTRARPLLPEGNMSLRVTLESRAAEHQPWRKVWSGEAYTLDEPTGQRRSADAQFASNSDRYWRLQVQQGKESMPHRPLRLQLGYVAGRLRFLAQGPGPYLLAYGSERAGPATAQYCDSLLAEMAEQDRRNMLGAARLGTARTLGGVAALEPVPKELPLRLLLLWALLIGGALTLVVMAYSLIRRISKPS